MKFSNLIFWNGLDYKKMKHKVLLFIVFVEADVDILMMKSLRKERKVFLRTFEVFLSQCGHNWCKNLEFQNTFRSTLKWPFPFEVYTKKKIYKQFGECKGFKNRFISRISQNFKDRFICIISEHSENYFYRKLF